MCRHQNTWPHSQNMCPHALLPHCTNWTSFLGAELVSLPTSHQGPCCSASNNPPRSLRENAPWGGSAPAPSTLSPFPVTVRQKLNHLPEKPRRGGLCYIHFSCPLPLTSHSCPRLRNSLAMSDYHSVRRAISWNFPCLNFYIPTNERHLALKITNTKSISSNYLIYFNTIFLKCTRRNVNF